VRKRLTIRLWPVAAVAAVLAFGAILALYALLHRDQEPAIEQPPKCFDGPVTPGIDVSYDQGSIAWPKVEAAGIRFAFIRISDGLTTKDALFEKNWAGAKTARIRRGMYQYFRPDQSATAQADLVIAAHRRDPGELPPVIDVETTGGKSPAQLERAIRTWVERVRARLHVEPIVYTSPDFWRDAVGDADLSSQPLWVAHYTAACPRVPAAWKRWTFWQHSEQGRVPGITGPVDLDVMAGESSTIE
jgi:lysozyme